MFMNHRCFAILALILVLPFSASFAEEKDEAEEELKFKTIKLLETTPVKDQAATGTCWSFAAHSFIETELIRMGKGEHDLSEMFAVRELYPRKAWTYVRYQGNVVFSPGGLFGDVLRVWREEGAMPESAYDGRPPGQERHNHSQMDKVLKAMLDALIENRGKGLPPTWSAAVEGVLDAYLGKAPKTFKYEGKRYTPREFADSLGFNPDDYVELTSFTHHPFDQWIVLEIPDNWGNNRSYNVPVDTLVDVFDRAIQKGYSVAWAADVSEPGFQHGKGKATLSAPDSQVTQAARQQAFDSYATTDDHGMHAVGIAEDENGDRYYMIKNSWGTGNKYEGYLYASQDYVRAKTLTIVVHRDALPPGMAKKMKKNR